MQTGNIRSQIPQAYPTNNAALAMVLHMCGVPFLIKDGVIFPGFNLYTPAFLESRGYKGYAIDTAIHELWHKGIPGQVVYQFERVPGSTLIQEISEAWFSQVEAIKTATAGSYERPGAPYASTPTTPKPLADADVTAKICCQYAKARMDFFGDRNERVEALWRRRGANNGQPFFRPCRAVEGASRIEHEGDKTFYYGSMKLQSVKV